MNLAVVDGSELVRIDSPDTRFQAGSVSKLVAAFTALRLVDAGELELDQEVNERLVAWRHPDGEDVTLRRLLIQDDGSGAAAVRAGDARLGGADGSRRRGRVPLRGRLRPPRRVPIGSARTLTRRHEHRRGAAPVPQGRDVTGPRVELRTVCESGA